MPINKFEKLFSPRAIAIVGASEDFVRPGGQAVRALQEFGYRGKVYPVNPKYKELAGLKCFPSVGEIGDAVDLAIIAVPAAAALDMVKTCGQIGIPYAVVFGGGFREIGPEGIARQNTMVACARAHGMRLVGPNCLGLVNIHERVYAAFGSIARPPLLAPGGVSLVMQSGGFGNSLALGCHAAGVGFRLIVASGNEADLTAPELIDALIDDPATEIILAYIEGVADGRALMAAGERALAAGKPVLVWKAGNTRQGARVAATHTANMTGAYDVWRAAFRQCGILEIRDISEAADYLKALSAKRFPRGRNVAVVSPSGGSAVAFSDAADAYGLTLPKPCERTAIQLSDAILSAVSMDNPIDLGAGGVSERTKVRVQRAVEILLADDDMHQLCFMFPTLIGPRAIAGASILAEVVSRTDKPMLVFWTVPREIVAKSFEMLEQARIPILSSPVRVARAAGMLADYAQFRTTRAERPGLETVAASSPACVTLNFDDEIGVLDEARSKRIVSAAGIAVSRDLKLTSADDSAIDKLDFNFPLAVKILSPDIAHKTDIGGVVLNVLDRTALRVAVAEVITNARRAHPAARIEGVLVSEMITDAVEVITGVVNDSVFGPVILLGMGGILAEAMHDVTYRVAPFDRVQAQEMIGELRAQHVLHGIRGKPACDVDALTDALVTLSQLAWRYRERISELDINPLLVRPRGHGVVAVDALMVLR